MNYKSVKICVNSWIFISVYLCFTKSFHFCLRFKEFVNKISHLLYTNKQYRCLLENYLWYITKLGFDQHPDLDGGNTQTWEFSALGSPRSQHIWSPNYEKSPLRGWDFKDCSSGLPFTIPGQLQTDIIINLWPNCSSGFMLMLFI